MIKKLLLSSLTALILLTGCKTSQKSPQEVVEKLGENPYFIIDDEPVDRSKLGNYPPSTIATVTTFYGKEAVQNYGQIAKDGAVIVETKDFATEKYENFFSAFSTDYKEMLSKTERSKIQYILNGEIQVENYEGKLSLLNRKTLKGLTIVNSTELSNQFGIENKVVGVILKSKK
jgi:hypothetical protein